MDREEAGIARAALPYGTWPSAVSATMAGQPQQIMPELHVDKEVTYWLEADRRNGAMSVFRAAPGCQAQVITPPGEGVGSRIYEYGGGSFTVRDGIMYYVGLAGQRIFRSGANRTALPVTTLADGHRYGDLRVLPDGRGVVCVRERHLGGQVTHDMVLAGWPGPAAPRVIHAGRDFYASPRLSPDGRSLAWMAWDHPAMPWTASEIWLGILGSDGTVRDARRVAGEGSESVFQPEWSPDGVLHFVSDRSGWWNLYRFRDGRVEPVAPAAAEFGLVQWLLDMSAYAFLPGGRIGCLFIRDGVEQLGILGPGDAEPQVLDLPYSSFWAIRSGGNRLHFVGFAARRPPELVSVDVRDTRVEVLRAARDAMEKSWTPVPEQIDVTTSHGGQVRGVLYRPANPRAQGVADGRPPLILTCHGGPTGQVFAQFSPQICFWTSRGFAVMDVNYRGSSGYGRGYRDAIAGMWGESDVADCVAAAVYLAERRLVDARRMVIRGASAGGLTVLGALASSSAFAAGISYFGVANLQALRERTHKFEQYYVDWLVGPWPRAAEAYRQRSPVARTAEIDVPVLFLHGALDTVVPPEQSAEMFRRLRSRGIACERLVLHDERHGFQRPDNIARCLEMEFRFLARVLGLPAGNEI